MPSFATLVYVALAILGLIYLVNWINVVKEWERRPVLFFGKYYKTLGPGISFLEPIFFTKLEDVTIQDVSVPVHVENAQTKDNVPLIVTGLLTYRVDEANVKNVVVEVENFRDAVMERALSTLTDEAGKQDLDHLLSSRDAFCESMKKTLAERVKSWGVTIQAFELKDLQIGDDEIAQAIAMKARAQKEGEAELVRAEMQKKIADALNEAAAEYDDKGRWLKSMEVMLEMTRSAQNNTVIIPADLAGMLGQALGKMGK